MRRLLTLDPQNPQPGQQWIDNDGFVSTVYTLTEYKAPYWHYTEERTALNGSGTHTYNDYILDTALRNNIKNDEPQPDLTAFDQENIARDLRFEAEAARIDTTPVPPMSRLAFDWQCLDCGHAWRGAKHCPVCGAGADEILDWTPRNA